MVSVRCLILTLGDEGLCLPPQAASVQFQVLPYQCFWQSQRAGNYLWDQWMTPACIIHIHGESSTSAHKMIFKSFINALKSRPAQPSLKPQEDVLLTWGKLAEINGLKFCLPSLFLSFPPSIFISVVAFPSVSPGGKREKGTQLRHKWQAKRNGTILIPLSDIFKLLRCFRGHLGDLEPAGALVALWLGRVFIPVSKGFLLWFFSPWLC